MDPVLAGLGPGGSDTSFNKGGYIFTYSPNGTTLGSVGLYSINADPILRGSSGQRSFFTNEPLVIRANATTAAAASDAPI